MLPAAASAGQNGAMNPVYGGPTLPDERIVGDGVVLRALEEQDIDAVAGACNDPETTRWLPLPRPYGRPEARWFIDIFAPTTRESGAGLIRAIERDGRLVGCVDVKRVDWAARTAEVGYWVAPWGRGSGAATRATLAISRWTLREQGFERVELRAATGNRASQRVAEKAGFVREGIARNAGHVRGGRVDLVVYSLTRADLGLEQPHMAAAPA
jgi:ribosomal-protein-serine acetyltransferase